jgi:hypothetical protein
MVVLVGPAWTASGPSVVDAGRFPLGVEAATLANAARLVPAVTSVTAHVRYYALHARMAAEAAAEGVTDAGEVVRRVRRAEVVLGALSVVHGADSPEVHEGPAPLAEAHGARVIAPALEDGVINVEDLAGRYSRQGRGFLAAYRGSEIALGLLDGTAGSLGPGPVGLSPDSIAALEPILALSRRKRLRRSELEREAATGCLCAVRSSADGRELRRLMFGGPGAPAADAEVRRVRTRTALTARLLVQATHDRSDEADEAMAGLCCFGDLDAVEDPQLQDCALRWRGALLRNRSVTAWRWLWWWLTERLVERPRTADELADALAEELVLAAGGDLPAHDVLTADLPERRSGRFLLDAESQLLYPGPDEESTQPLDYLRCLAVGALRLQDLRGPALQTFLEPAGFGPVWVQGWLGGLGTRALSEVGRELTGLLLRTAEELSRRKARWEGKQLRLSTRLRPVGDVLHLAGREGSIPAGLRLGRLAGMLVELDFLRDDGTHWHRGPVAAEWGW